MLNNETRGEICATCRFWKPITDAEVDPMQGYCRAHPPKVLQQIHIDRNVSEGPYAAELVTTWPVIEEDEWCGEFAQ